MEEVIEYVLNHFGIERNDLKPSFHPTKESLKARIILSAFLKERNFRNEQIQAVFFTKDSTNIYLLKQRFYDNEYPELNDLHRELTERFKNAQGKKQTNLLLKNCICCKQKKENQTNFRRYESGRFSNKCLLCEETPVRKGPKPKQKVVTVKMIKPKTTKPTVMQIAKNFRAKLYIKPQPTVEELQQANQKRESELQKNGTRFVKSTKHIRAYVLPKNNN